MRGRLQIRVLSLSQTESLLNIITSKRTAVTVTTQKVENSSNGPVRSFKDIPAPSGFYKIPYIGFVFHLQPFSELPVFVTFDSAKVGGGGAIYTHSSLVTFSSVCYKHVHMNLIGKSDDSREFIPGIHDPCNKTVQMVQM